MPGRHRGPWRRVIGVLGGMGPEASAELLTRLVRAVDAETDQDHPRIVVDSDPSVPDRTAALLSGGPDPLPALRAMCERLERAGAEVLAIPCNTAHAFLHDLRPGRRAELVDMVGASAEEARRAGTARVGLLATDGTVRTGLYDAALGRRGLEVVVPAPREQAAAMQAIRHVKAGRLDDAWAVVQRPLAALTAQGVPVLVGCTDLSVLFRHRARPDAPVIDPLDVLVDRCLAAAAREPAAGGPG